MRIEIHHIHHADKKTKRKLEEILQLLREIKRKEVIEMKGIDDLKAQVEENSTVIGSAITLVQGLKQALDTAIASGDMSQVVALRDKLATDDQALAAAVAASVGNQRK